MTRQAFIKELMDRLRDGHVADFEEIAAEYAEHFDRKQADGFTDEEIVVKLGSPKEIALQFEPTEDGANKKLSNKPLIAVGLFFSDIVVIPFLIVMYAWVASLAAVALSSAAYGVCLLLRPMLSIDTVIMPNMPYPGGALLGVSMMALGVLAALAVVYSFKLTGQMGKAYRRWHKNMMSEGKYPPYTMHPVLKDSLRRRLRSVGLIALIVFIAAFVLGFLVLSIKAGALGFWHVWHWFV